MKKSINRFNQQIPLNITSPELAQCQAIQQQILKLYKHKWMPIIVNGDAQTNKKQGLTIIGSKVDTVIESNKPPPDAQFFTSLPTVIRFSVARQFDHQAAIKMWQEWIRWYLETRPDILMLTFGPSIGPGQLGQRDSSLERLHNSRKYRFVGIDRDGYAVLIIRMRFHVQGLGTVDEALRYLHCMIERGLRLARSLNTHQLTVIYDRRQMGQSDEASSQAMKRFMPMLNNYYPELLRKFLVLGANMFYRAMWKVISVFISKRTQEKIKLLQDQAQLLEHIAPEQLLTEYGGLLAEEGIAG